MICTRLPPGHLSVRFGDSSRSSEEIAEKSRIAPFVAIVVIVSVSVSVLPGFLVFFRLRVTVRIGSFGGN